MILRKRGIPTGSCGCHSPHSAEAPPALCYGSTRSSSLCSGDGLRRPVPDTSKRLSRNATYPMLKETPSCSF